MIPAGLVERAIARSLQEFTVCNDIVLAIETTLNELKHESQFSNSEVAELRQKVLDIIPAELGETK
jgi:hypothetical protein